MMEILPSRKFKCAFCKGTGIQPCSLRKRCIACRGKGVVEFKGPVIKCPTCQGASRGSYSSQMACIRCRGVGVIEKYDKAGDSVADIIGTRLSEMTKRLRWTRTEMEKKQRRLKET